jgi:hypothetical protein
MCLDYVGEGTLYGGQPYCAQGPVIYLLGYGIRGIIGDGGMLHAMWALVLTASAVNVCLLRRVLILQGLWRPRLFALAYLLTTYRFIDDVTSTLAASLLICGFYALRHGAMRPRGVLAGIAFALAILTKYTSLLPAAIIIAYDLFARGLIVSGTARKPKVALVRDPSVVLAFTACASAIMVAYIAAHMAYPHMTEYTILAHAGLVKPTLAAAYGALAEGISLEASAALALFAGLAYCVLAGLFGKDTILYALLQSTLAVYGALFLMTDGASRIGTSYMLPAYPFLAMAWTAVWPRSRKAYALMFLAAVVFPSIYGSPLAEASRAGFDGGKASAVRMVEYGLHYIPSQKGEVLIETDAYKAKFREYGTPVDPSKIVVIPSGEPGYGLHEDPSWAPNLRAALGLGDEDFPAYRNVTREETAIREGILSGRYSLIVVGPPVWVETTLALNDVRPYVSDNYCAVYAPNFQYAGRGRFDTALYFRDARDCARTRGMMARYYLSSAYRICALGGQADRVVRTVLEWDGVKLPGACENAEEFAYTDLERNRLGPADILLFALLFLPVHWLLGLIGDD